MLVYIPAALLLLVCSVPQLQQLVRSRLRPWLVREVARQLSLTVQLQSLPWAEGQLLDTVAKWSAATVSVEFYITALPILHMAGYPRVALLVLCLSLSCYVGCALKDVLCGPRPYHFTSACARLLHSSRLDGISNGMSHGTGTEPSPQQIKAAQQVKLLGHRVAEFGAPSTHVLLALVMNGVIASTLLHPAPSSAAATTGSEHLAATSMTKLQAAASQAWGEHTPTALYALTVVWAAWVGYTRLHLGVHSLADCVLGAIVGIILLAALVPLGPAWERWLLNGGLSSCGVMLLLHVLALKLYPKTPVYTGTFQDVTTFMGAHLGCCLGAVIHWGHHLSRASVAGLIQVMSHLIDGQKLQDHLVLYQIEWLVMKVFMGLLVVMVVLKVSKLVILAGLPPLLRQLPLGLRSLWQPPISCDFTEIGSWSGVIDSDWFTRPQQEAQGIPSANGAADDVVLDGKEEQHHEGRAAGARTAAAGMRRRGPVESMANGVGGHNGVANHTGKTGQGLGLYVVTNGGEAGQRVGHGMPCRQDGLPLDVDVFRRYVSYTLAVFAMWQFSAAADVALQMLMQAAEVHAQTQ